MHINHITSVSQYQLISQPSRQNSITNTKSISRFISWFRNKNHRNPKAINLMNSVYGATSYERRKPDQFLTNNGQEALALNHPPKQIYIYTRTIRFELRGAFKIHWMISRPNSLGCKQKFVFVMLKQSARTTLMHSSSQWAVLRSTVMTI